MRILQVSSLWPPHVLGGAEIYAERLLEELARRGHDVGVVTYGVPGERVIGSVPAWPYALADFATEPSWRRVAFRAVDLYNPAAPVVLRRAIAQFRPDVIHSHSIAGLSPTVMACASRSASGYVHHLHDYWLLCRRTNLVKRSGEACTQRCLSCQAIGATRSTLLTRHPPDVVVAPSDSIADRHLCLSWMRGRVHRLNHPVDQPRQARERVLNAGQPVTFGFAGQLTPSKGVLTLLRAFRGMEAVGHRLLVAGRGPLLDTVRAGGAGVTALGWIEAEAKDRFFADIDCLVVPSEWPENAPLVVLEARANGIPVIGARIGGIPELIDSRSRPLLFNPRDEASLKAALQTFAATPERFTPVAAGGMSWDEHVQALMHLYGVALERRSRR